MSQKANNWSHTSERGSLQQALADAGVQSGPAVTGGVMAPSANMPMNQGLATTTGLSGGGGAPVVNSSELRPYQSGRLGLDSEMIEGVEIHGPNGPYPTRPADQSDPHQLSTKLPAAGQHNEINIPVTGGTMENHPTMGERAKAAMIPGRNAHEQAAMDRTGQTSHGMGNHPTMGERAKAAFIPGRDAHEQAAMDRTGQTMSSSHGMGDNPTMGERAKAAVIPGRDSHEQAALDRSGYAGSGITGTGMTGTGMTGTHHTGTGMTGSGMTGTHGTTGTESGIQPTMGQKVKAAFSSLTAEEIAMQDAQKKASSGTHPHGHKGEMATAGAAATGHPVAAAGLAAGTHQHHHHSAQHAGTSSSTATSGTGTTADKPWIPRQFGPMPPGSTIKDPAHHPGFATHVVTEQIPVTDAAGREASITKQTVITAQETLLGLLRRDQQLLSSLFQQWFATRDMTQREHLWWEIEHELQMLDAGHTGVLHSALNKHLTKDMGYDHSGSFREYSAMRSLVGDMNKLSVTDPTFETKMTQLQNMTNNYYMEQSRYLPLFEQNVGNQALIDYGTQYNMKKSGIRDTKHQTRLASNKTQSSNLHERDREHGAMADKHMEQGHKPTLKEKVFGTHDKSHDKTSAPASGTMPNMTGAYPNTSTHTATTTSSNTGRM